MIVGLVGYVLWRLVQSIFDTDDHGLDPKGLAVRGGLLASAFTYSALVLYALGLLGVFTASASGGGSGGNTVVNTLNGFVAYRWIALALAAVFAGVAVAHFLKAYEEKYADHLDTASAPMSIVHVVSRIGLSARGVVLLVIAILFFYRFLSANTGSSGGGDRPGLKEALDFVQGLPAGAWLLAALGLGLIAFACYSLLEARYRVINVHDA